MTRTDFNKNPTKEALIGMLRAMVLRDNLRVEFQDELVNEFFLWNQNLVTNDEVFVPEISHLIFGDKNHQIRAASDLAAAYLLFHDGGLHRQNILTSDEQKFFDEFEKIRVLCCVKDSFFGSAKNLLQKIEDEAFSGAGNISLLLLKHVFHENILPRTGVVISDLELGIGDKIKSEISSLTSLIFNQISFGRKVLKILELLKKEQEAPVEKKSDNLAQENQSQNLTEELNNFGAENSPQKDDENFLTQNEELEKESSFEASLNLEIKEDSISETVESGLQEVLSEDSGVEFKNSYKVYTTKFDEVVYPQKLVNKNDLELLRDQLDLKMQNLAGISKKMTFKLKRKLLSKRNSFVDRDNSRGILDRKKMIRLITDPLVEDVWVNQKNHDYHDTVLTVLLDNSGSMRGAPIVMSALACEIIADILEKFAVKTEIIGFTTADWKGGKVKKLWETSGRPINPGRLNELRHIIYKHFNQGFKKAKINLGLMLKEGILKENIDGEALLFARSRLMQRAEKRKILMVISDGTPVDDSTNSVNDKNILTDHLSHVINKIEKGGKIEIIGVGIGHATDEFYRNSIAIKSLEDLGDAMIQKISEVL